MKMTEYPWGTTSKVVYNDQQKRISSIIRRAIIRVLLESERPMSAHDIRDAPPNLDVHRDEIAREILD